MSTSKPNVLIIITDQQNANMLGAAGNPYLKTPALDSLCESGVRFQNAYCTNPMCVPSRFSLVTGRLASSVGVHGFGQSRSKDPIPDEYLQRAIGWTFRHAGYKTTYAGKEHFPRMKAVQAGFEKIDAGERDGLADFGEEFFRQDHEDPFVCVTSFINPHDICYMALRENAVTDFDRRLVENDTIAMKELDKALQRPDGVDEETFWRELCPPLATNFGPQDDEPGAIQELLDERPFRRHARETWAADRWRMHRWAYARLTERVDAQIGRVLDSLNNSQYAQNTIVVFTSDHGDLDGAHGLEHKDCLYDEAVHVPFIIRDPRSGKAGLTPTQPVSNGLDLLPTLCDLAGVTPPEGLIGKSLRPLLEGDAPSDWRDALPIESQFGNAVQTDRFRYCHYDRGCSREQLYDRRCDPYETWNHLHRPENAQAVADCRARFDQYWPGMREQIAE
jgi:choline-sulfatase